MIRNDCHYQQEKLRNVEISFLIMMTMLFPEVMYQSRDSRNEKLTSQTSRDWIEKYINGIGLYGTKELNIILFIHLSACNRHQIPGKCPNGNRKFKLRVCLKYVVNL